MGETYNPIGTTKDYENGFFSPIPVPPPGYANVLTGSQNEGVPLVIQSRDIPRKEQIRQGKYRWITQIDIQPHGVSFTAELLANDNISHFHVTVDMLAHVELPGQVCLDNITDVAAAVKSAILPDLQAKAIQYEMDDIQQLRDDVNDWLKGVILLDTGIQLENIRTHIQPDQAYISRKEALRRAEQEKEDKLRKLREKEEYEMGRARVADKLSTVYASDVTQIFAELASETMTPEEAAQRVEARRRNQSAGDFDEKVRQVKEIMELVKMAQDAGIGSPDIVTQTADIVLGGLFASSTPALDGGSPSVPVLEGNSLEQANENPYAPPSDD